jgi:hypothetical protein
VRKGLIPVALAALAMISSGISVQAQPLPNQTLPSYAQPNAEQTIKGRINAIVDAFNITVLDDNGYLDNVRLHRGTIINPTGLTLAAGMLVTILGYNAGTYFEANEIDTPYRYSGALPPPVYYGPGWWYPGYVYGYGPAWSLVIGVGGTIVRSPFPHHAPYIHPPYPRPYVSHPYVGRPPISHPPAPHTRYPTQHR